METGDKKLDLVWSDKQGRYVYELSTFIKNSWLERFISGERGWWETVAEGGEFWARQIAAHYALELPKPIKEEDEHNEGKD